MEDNIVQEFIKETKCLILYNGLGFTIMSPEGNVITNLNVIDEVHIFINGYMYHKNEIQKEK